MLNRAHCQHTLFIYFYPDVIFSLRNVLQHVWNFNSKQGLPVVMTLCKSKPELSVSYELKHEEDLLQNTHVQVSIFLLNMKPEMLQMHC